LAATLLVASTSEQLVAQGKSHGQDQDQGQGRGHKNKDKDKKGEDRASGTVVFRDQDRVAFQNYFAEHRMTARALPPGIAKRLARGKPLPPGIAKRALPPDLLRIAPSSGRDVSYSIVGTSVVATRAGIVIDILNSILK
jgi:hypothetical protein